MKILNQYVVLVLLLGFLCSASVAQTKVILKLDDLKAKNGSSQFTPVMDYLKSKKIKAGLGAIGNGFDESSLTLLSPYLNATNDHSEKIFEIWHHGWDHKDPEFKGTSYDYQKAHFDQTNQAILDYLGIQMQTFGPPFNRSDDNTRKVLTENPNYKVFLFTNAVIPDVVSLQNRVDMENGVGNPDYSFFIDQYNSNSSLDYMVLQGHPAMWSASKLDQFKSIIDFLIVQGCEFVLPYEMAIEECKENEVPQAPQGFLATPTASRQITLTWLETDDNIRSFVIERKETDDAYSVIAYPERSASSYIDNEIVDRHTYVYRISTLNCFGLSGFSQEEYVHLEEDTTSLLPVVSVSASSYLANYRPENTIDNKLNTYWLSQGEGEWLELELHEAAAVQRVNISFIKGNEREFEFSLESSMDGFEWNAIGQFKSSGTTTHFEEFNFEAANAKYLRYITDSNSVDELTWLAEIELRGNSNLLNTIKKVTSRSFFVVQSRFSDDLQIVIYDNQFRNAYVSVFDILGKRRIFEKVDGSQQIITSGLAPGIYMVKLEIPQLNSIQKIQVR